MYRRQNKGMEVLVQPARRLNQRLVTQPGNAWGHRQPREGRKDFPRNSEVHSAPANIRAPIVTTWNGFLLAKPCCGICHSAPQKLPLEIELLLGQHSTFRGPWCSYFYTIEHLYGFSRTLLFPACLDSFINIQCINFVLLWLYFENFCVLKSCLR